MAWPFSSKKKSPEGARNGDERIVKYGAGSRLRRSRQPNRAEIALGLAESMRAGGYDTADNKRLTKDHWDGVSSKDADSEATGPRPTLRNRARYEIRNNGFAKGMTDTYAADLVGAAGPTLNVNTGRPPIDKKLKNGFDDWATVCDAGRRLTLTDILVLSIKELFRSGEAFIQLVNSDSTPFAGRGVKLRLLMIEADRIKTPFKFFSDKDVRDGIRIDPVTGAAVSYYVSKVHPGFRMGAGALVAGAKDSFIEIPATEMIHLYDVDRPGQTRGIPKISPAIDLFGQLRDYTRDVMMAARTAAMLCAFTHSSSPDIEPQNLGDDLPVDDLEPGTNTLLPAGYDISQIKPEQPATTFPMFRKEILSETGRCVGMPFNVVAANSSGYNYSSSKLDWQIYGRQIDNMRRVVENTVLDRVFAIVARELIFSGAVFFRGRPFVITPQTSSWFWAGFEHADPSREAKALETNLKTKVKSFVAACQEDGRDYRKVLDEWKETEDYVEKIGLKDWPGAVPDEETINTAAAEAAAELAEEAKENAEDEQADAEA